MSESVRRARHRTPPEVRVAVGAAGAATAAGFCWTLTHGLAQPEAALAFGLLIVLGEVAGDHRAGAPARIPAPLATAGALGYALLCIPADAAGGAVLEIAAVSFTATVVGAVPHVARGRGPTAEHLVRRVLGTAFAAACCRPLCAGAPVDGDGGPVAGLAAGPGYVLALLGVLALTALCDAVLAACLARARTGWPYGPLLRDELRALPGVGSAMCATGVVIALAAQVAGPWALPVLSLPLLLTQVSFRRYAAVRRTYRQTIASLARATEMAGYHSQGHAHRVAALSRAIGRVRGLSERELDVLEQAALMHDLGKLSLADPVPPGGDGTVPPGAESLADRRRVALLGGAVVRQTGVAAEVAVVVERQAEPYRDQPVAARIVRVAAAYDVLVAGNAKGEGAVAAGPLAALERLRLATADEYDPVVVDALREVLASGVCAN
ncbi:metal-dependent phosphohydrolase [Streptomyces sp. WAC 06738]|uniref:HD domain-containing protein n=1 Tax=Streptomyces sp. WAC 06738 TaxID=2203210 RepID=UPI000F6CEE34|nr:HD domain-containing protein [Streptomyces sp. WAC 06738]AZM48540.1 metal-dependent phosphohydrolase [Streptomyces sp. WAC 06738]